MTVIDPDSVIKTRREYLPVGSTAVSLPQTVLIIASRSITDRKVLFSDYRY
jgi:hypothetical protein